MKKKRVWKKGLVFSLIAAMVLSLMPAELFSKKARADENYRIITCEKDMPVDSIVYSDENAYDPAMFTESSDGLRQFVAEDGEEFTEELPYYLRDDYNGYLPLDVERGSSKVDPSLSYREARDMLVSKPSDNLSGDVKGSITDRYDFSIPSAYPAEYDDEAALENYVKTVLPPLLPQDLPEPCHRHRPY